MFSSHDSRMRPKRICKRWKLPRLAYNVLKVSKFKQMRYESKIRNTSWIYYAVTNKLIYSLVMCTNK